VKRCALPDLFDTGDHSSKTLLGRSHSFANTVCKFYDDSLVCRVLAWGGPPRSAFALLFILTSIIPGSMMLAGFAPSVLSSLTAIVVLYLLHMASAAYARKCLTRAECWWLPGALTFRFVIRNISRKANLFSIRYRAWLRKVVPASETMSVERLWTLTSTVKISISGPRMSFVLHAATVAHLSVLP
jgi:hypothetical protein